MVVVLIFLFPLFLQAVADSPTDHAGKVTLVGPSVVILKDASLEYLSIGPLQDEGINIMVEDKAVFVSWSDVQSLSVVADTATPHWSVVLKDGRTFPDYDSLQPNSVFIGTVYIKGTEPHGGGTWVESLSPKDPSSFLDFQKILVDF